MRRMIPVLGAVLGLALLTGAGAVAAAAPTVAPVAATSVAAAPVSAAPVSIAAAKKKLVLGPKGVGALKLGMTRKQAKATKMLRKHRGSENGTCTVYRLKKAGTNAPVFYSKKRGVASITAYKGLATPQGIKLGSSAKAVKKAYPSWRSITEEGLDGRGFAKVPGNRKAYYNISIAHGTVVYLQLQLKNQNCYE